MASIAFLPGYAETRSTQLPAGRLAALSSLAWPMATAGLPLGVLLPAIYAQQYGVPLAMLGLLFLVCRIWDAVTDPLIGALSDRTRSRWGRRKPWIAAGAVLFGLFAFLLFFPQGEVTTLSLGLILFAFYLGWTMIQIPFAAWTGEISGEYHERTRVQTFLHVSTAAALFATLLIPTFLDQVRPGDNALKLAAMGGFVLVTLAISVPLALRSFPEPKPGPEGERASLGETLHAVASDRLLLRILASDFAVSLGQGIRASLIVFYVSFVMGRPEWGAGLYLLQFAFGIAAGPIWLKIGRRFGKHRTAVVGEIAQVGINLGLLAVTRDALAKRAMRRCCRANGIWA
ncbi:MFS transporter [Sandaracinobacteroides hominis]|uniref:MFS transporter n=1 Tax=Sandaracinobacteroides hominis TaxID=2780086 RepID=UPI002E28F0BE|nr:MFS transporter [Sandaracinobacteroides hominis]